MRGQAWENRRKQNMWGKGDLEKPYKGPPYIFVTLLQHTLSLEKLVCMDYINGPPCPLASGWVWPRRGTSKKAEGGRRMKSKNLFPQLPAWHGLWLASTACPQPWLLWDCLSMELFYQLWDRSLHLSFIPGVIMPTGLHYPLLVCSSLAHTLVNSLFVRHSSNY